ncbi:MAG: TonB-dependent receptor [Prevotella sp.]|nr:TonB-dependent receptor [Prevotella sp.]
MTAQHRLTGRMDSMQHVSEVVVTSKLTFREVIPSQKLNGEELERLSVQSVADALRYFSGVQLKDYGGVGGVKTVDVRAMGTNHLAVSYDGIVLGNAQNGQIDLGQFSLDNVEEVTLYNGQKSAIFQPASDFASASSVYIRTRTPRFEVGKNQNLKAKLKYGASDLLRVSTLYEQRFSPDLSLGVNGEWMTASGKYHFRYRRKNLDGTTAWDTTAVRQNGDIHAERLEANLHGLLTQGAWQLKGYVYNSARGIPGAIVNNVWQRGERQQDLNTFVQGHMQKSVGERFSTQWLMKYAYYDTHYVNRDTTRLPVDNRYKQQEYYLSTSNVVELLPGWSASMSYDLRWNHLSADTYRFAFPTRWTHMLSAATAVDYRHVKVQGSVVGTWINDHRRDQTETKHVSRLTPALFANVYPLRRGKWLSLRAYVKQSFRMPTFNDLYYTEIGNANLRPERATQYDVGLVLSRHFTSGRITHVSLHADAYYNKVHDKIIAYPKGQQFRWTMLNLGKVDIRGLDVVASISGSVCRDMIATLRAQYTFQRAIDVTDSRKPYYRDQIPYIPRHSGSLILGLDWRRLSVNYSFLYTGERWNEQENTAYNHMQPWYTSDLSARYKWNVGRHELAVFAELNNLLNQQYDVILNYPMPGRNAAVGLTFEL